MNNLPPFSGKLEQLNFFTHDMYNLNTNLWPFTTPNVRTTCRIWKIIAFLEFLSQGRRSEILLNKIQALLIFDPLITPRGHFKAPYFKMLNDARVASACLYVRTCQRARNSKNIATIRDFHLPSSFFWLSTRLSAKFHAFDTASSKIHLDITANHAANLTPYSRAAKAKKIALLCSIC